MADITFVNLNMLFVRYAESQVRELHLPLGLLYLTSVLEAEGIEVDLRDYQACPAEDPFNLDAFLEYVKDPAPIVGISCMANLLSFAILAAERLKARYPDRTLILGGVGAKCVEPLILKRFPWIDLIAHGEGERAIVPLVRALRERSDLSTIPGLFRRTASGQIVCNPAPPRIERLDTIPRPAWHRLDLRNYHAYGMISSRGCPYPCTFCSAAPVWDHLCKFRSAKDVVDEMQELYERTGMDLFLFQDEFFVSSKRAVAEFCEELRKRELKLLWKAFARVDLSDDDLLRAMAETGCIEIRFGIETGSNRMLSLTKKGFTSEMASDVVSRAVRLFPRVDTFFVWGYPEETLDDFYQSLLQMVTFRLIGAHILPSLLCLLPQTELYRSLTPDQLNRLEFCEDLYPEYVMTGHEVCRVGAVSLLEAHRVLFDFIRAHRDIFPGFFLLDLETNVRPKLAALQDHGFYTRPERDLADLDTCGAHSPRIRSETSVGAHGR